MTLDKFLSPKKTKSLELKKFLERQVFLQCKELMEENLRRSLLISDGSWSFMWDRPLTIVIMLTIIFIVGWQIYKSFFKKKL